MRQSLLILYLLVGAWSIAVGGEDPDQQHVLVVNDDGVDATGLEALVGILVADPAYRVTVVAPTEQQSGSGSALTIRGDIPLRSHAPIAGAQAWSVNATPATTARIGLAVVLAEDPPDLVVSGINKGENVGRIAWYSGTVGAAREAVLAGYPAVAFSLQLNWADPRPDYDEAARWAKPVVDALRGQPLPEGVYLNVNIPHDSAMITGYQLCRMGLEAPQVAGFETLREENGVRYLKSLWAPALGYELGSDTAALHQGLVTVTPLGLDATAYTAFPQLPVLMNVAAPPAAMTAVTGMPDSP